MYRFILLFKEKKHEKSQTISAVYFLLFIFIFQIFFPDFHARDISKMTDFEKTCSDHILLKTQYLRNPRNIFHVKIHLW